MNVHSVGVKPGHSNEAARNTGPPGRETIMQAEPILPEARVRAMKDSSLWPGRILLDDFDRWVARTPDRVAIIDHNSMTGQRTVLTYAKLGRRVDRIAAGLAGLGVGRGDVVS